MLQGLRVLGIDEAGRGSVLGDLVMAGVVVSSEAYPRVSALSIKDSKTFNTAKYRLERVALSNQIQKLCPTYIARRSAQAVDAAVARKALNALERDMAAEIMAALAWDFAVLDGASIFRPLVAQSNQKLKQNVVDVAKITVQSFSDIGLNTLHFLPAQPTSTVTALNKADSQYLAVAAASILAKVERDQTLERLFASLKQPYSNQGLGYPNAATLATVQSYLQNEKTLMPFFRQAYKWKAFQTWLANEPALSLLLASAPKSRFNSFFYS